MYHFRNLQKRKKRSYIMARQKKMLFFIKQKIQTSPANLILHISAVYTVENALSKVKDEKGMKRVERFLKEDVCPDCGGTRLSKRARLPKNLCGITLADACKMSLSELVEWVNHVPDALP